MITVVAAGESCTVDTGPTPPVPAYPKLQFADDFEGTSLNPKYWTIRSGNQGDNERSSASPSAVTVHDSMVTIKASPTPLNGRPYTSGYIDSINKVSIKPGSFVEWRSRLPLAPGKSAGLWPALWLRLLIGLLEIDVQEGWGDNFGIQSADPRGHYQTSVWPSTMSATNGVHGWAVSNQDLTQWHVYGVLIEADCSVTFYFDGKPTSMTMNGRTYTRLSSDEFTWLKWDGTKDSLAIRHNLQVGQVLNGTTTPGYWGLPNAQTDFSQTFDTDYVRVWTAS